MNYICKGRSQEKILVQARSDAVHIVRLIGIRSEGLGSFRRILYGSWC